MPPHTNPQVTDLPAPESPNRAPSRVKPGGTLIINDYVVDDDRSGPPFALIFAGEMLLKSKQGGTWRQADYLTRLAKAGFDDITFHPTPSPATLVFAG